MTSSLTSSDNNLVVELVLVNGTKIRIRLVSSIVLLYMNSKLHFYPLLESIKFVVSKYYLIIFYLM